MSNDELDQYLIACAAQYPGSDEWNAMRGRLRLAIDAAVQAECESQLRRLIEWIQGDPRRNTSHAFTASPLREAADWVNVLVGREVRAEGSGR